MSKDGLIGSLFSYLVDLNITNERMVGMLLDLKLSLESSNTEHDAMSVLFLTADKSDYSILYSWSRHIKDGDPKHENL